MVRFLFVGGIVKVHQRLVDTYGGATGVRDYGSLVGAVEQPKLSYQYGIVDLCELASCYCYYICKDHPFADGNKRTAYITMVLFLRANGLQISPSTSEAITIMLDLANNRLSREQLAQWLKDSTQMIDYISTSEAE